MTLDFGEMIIAHARWKAKLRAAIEGQEQIDLQAAGKDNQCELGKWIHGEGKVYAGVSEYGDLKTKHAKFHACIPNVMNQARLSSPAKGLELLDPTTGDFGRASSECINAIGSLKRAVAKG